MSIKQHGGIFGRNPTFNDVGVEGTLTIDGSLVVNGASMAPIYRGTWDASTNTPTLASGVGTEGDFYIVSAGGSTTLDGVSTWGVGDWVLFNGTTWQRVEGGVDGDFGNILVSGNTISTTNTNGTLEINPDGTGGVGVGGDTVGVVAGASVSSKFCVKDDQTRPTAGFVHAQNTNPASGSWIYACRSRGTLDTPTAVQDDDNLATWFVAGHDGTDLAIAAQITFDVDGTPGNNDMPGRIVISTTPDGTQIPVEAVRIDSAQKVTFAGDVEITGGSITGITDLAVADGGTGASDAAGARTNLGLGTIATQNNNSVNIDGGTIDGTAVNATTLTASGDVDFDSGTLFVDESTDRVGIGTTSPVSLLDVSSSTGSASPTPTTLTISSSTTASDWSTTDPWAILGFYSDDSSGGGAQNLAQISAIMSQTQGGFSSLDFTLANPGASYAHTSWLKLQNSAAGAGRKVVIDASGGLEVIGALSKGSGSFKIDHPLKPDTHHLVHSFVEGPQADLIYRGKVSLVNGQATVNIDEAGRMTEGTFEALNCNVQCFTNNESGWACVRGSVSGNILTIEAQDETCTDEISWMVIGERCDQHMIDTDWTDENGRVITEPEKTQEILESNEEQS